MTSPEKTVLLTTHEVESAKKSPVTQKTTGVRKALYITLIVAMGLVTTAGIALYRNTGSGHQRPPGKKVFRQPSDHMKNIEEIEDGSIEGLWLAYTGAKGKQVHGKFQKEKDGYSLELKDQQLQYMLRNRQKIVPPENFQPLFGKEIDPHSILEGVYKERNQHGDVVIAIQTTLKNGAVCFRASDIVDIIHAEFGRTPKTKNLFCRMPFRMTGDFAALLRDPGEQLSAHLLLNVSDIRIVDVPTN